MIHFAKAHFGVTRWNSIDSKMTSKRLDDWVLRALFPRLKLSTSEADHASPSRADFKNDWNFISRLVRFSGVVSKHRDNLTFLFTFAAQ